MSIFNKSTDVKRILQALQELGYFLLEIYKSTPKNVDVSKSLPKPLPQLFSQPLPQPLLLPLP
jgi:hypothetical protein